MKVLQELKRRNVLRVAAAYLVSAWLILQVADVVLPMLEAPLAVGRFLLFLLIAGFPLTLLLAWFFELTMDGVVKESDIPEARPDRFIPGRKFDIVTIVLLAVALGYFIYESRFQTPAEPDTHAIAVLPFVDLSEAGDQEVFCDGLTEELIHFLAKVPGIRVPARSTVFSLKGRKLDVRELGDALGVAHVLEGSVRRAGDRLRITAQLSDVEAGFSIWLQTYDRDMEDIFIVQDSIARNIARSLEVTLRPQDVRQLQRGRTEVAAAYDYYLRGKGFEVRTRQGTLMAREMFERAIELDPNYAAAFAALAMNYHAYYYTYERREQDAQRESIDRFSRRALALDPDLAEAHVARGLYLAWHEGFEAGRPHFEKAIELDPTMPEAYEFYGAAAASNGDMAAAAALYEKRNELELDWQRYMLLPQFYRNLGRKEDELQAYRRLVEIVERFLTLNPDDLLATLILGRSLLALGERERGLERVYRVVEDAASDEARLLYNSACTLAIAGETEAAIDTLERAYRAGYADDVWMEGDSDLDSLRDHPRFMALAERMKSESSD